MTTAERLAQIESFVLTEPAFQGTRCRALVLKGIRSMEDVSRLGTANLLDGLADDADRSPLSPSNRLSRLCCEAYTQMARERPEERSEALPF